VVELEARVLAEDSTMMRTPSITTKSSVGLRHRR
jgi:hypothetical protein